MGAWLLTLKSGRKGLSMKILVRKELTLISVGDAPMVGMKVFLFSLLLIILHLLTLTYVHAVSFIEGF